jgi:hypothetical protein
MVKTYRGQRDALHWETNLLDGATISSGKTTVTVDEQSLAFRHDLQGENDDYDFNWGYGAHGATELATALLADYFKDDKKVLAYRGRFKRKAITSIKKDNWVLTSDDIGSAIADIDLEAKVERHADNIISIDLSEPGVELNKKLLDHCLGSSYEETTEGNGWDNYLFKSGVDSPGYSKSGELNMDRLLITDINDRVCCEVNHLMAQWIPCYDYSDIAAENHVPSSLDDAQPVCHLNPRTNQLLYTSGLMDITLRQFTHSKEVAAFIDSLGACPTRFSKVDPMEPDQLWRSFLAQTHILSNQPNNELPKIKKGSGKTTLKHFTTIRSTIKAESKHDDFIPYENINKFNESMLDRVLGRSVSADNNEKVWRGSYGRDNSGPIDSFVLINEDGKLCLELLDIHKTWEPCYYYSDLHGENDVADSITDAKEACYFNPKNNQVFYEKGQHQLVLKSFSDFKSLSAFIYKDLGAGPLCYDKEGYIDLDIVWEQYKTKYLTSDHGIENVPLLMSNVAPMNAMSFNEKLKKVEVSEKIDKYGKNADIQKESDSLNLVEYDELTEVLLGDDYPYGTRVPKEELTWEGEELIWPMTHFELDHAGSDFTDTLILSLPDKCGTNEIEIANISKYWVACYWYGAIEKENLVADAIGASKPICFFNPKTAKLLYDKDGFVLKSLNNLQELSAFVDQSLQAGPLCYNSDRSIYPHTVWKEYFKKLEKSPDKPNQAKHENSVKKNCDLKPKGKRTYETSKIIYE